MLIALTHDIDRTSKSYQYITKSISHIVKGNISGVFNQIKSLSNKRSYWTFKHFIDIEEKYNVRSTVFFLNETIKLNILKPDSFKLALGRYKIKDPEITDIIRWLDKNGWEIGVHGSFNSFNDANMLASEKKALENIVKHPIIGIRQHYLNLNGNTWRFQKEVGFKYDSSWGYTDNIGFKGNKVHPFFPLADDFTVIPLVIMDTCFMAKPNRWEVYEELLDQCKQNEAVMVINFHQHVFNKFDFPGFEDAYIELIERALKRDARFLTLYQIYDLYNSKNSSW
ncbi:MAG: polysaccharide deacetylase family protein [Desulfobacula sp.]|nr:polysaccharide deacetylase family protein [Desulfobacula sp.]